MRIPDGEHRGRSAPPALVFSGRLPPEVYELPRLEFKLLHRQAGLRVECPLYPHLNGFLHHGGDGNFSDPMMAPRIAGQSNREVVELGLAGRLEL